MRRGMVIGVTAAVLVAGCSSGSKKSDPPASSAMTPTGSASVLAVNSGGLLAGTARPSFPAGTPGKVDVVAAGTVVDDPAGAYVPIAIRNNQASPVGQIDITAAVHDSGGKQIVTGKSQQIDPQTLAPGEIGLSFVHFEAGTAAPPADARYTYTVQSQTPSATVDGRATLKVTAANLVRGAVTGAATNQTGTTLSGPYTVNVYCFDATGRPLAVQAGFASPDGDLATSRSVRYGVNLAGHACPTFLVGVTAFYA